MSHGQPPPSSNATGGPVTNAWARTSSSLVMPIESADLTAVVIKGEPSEVIPASLEAEAAWIHAGH